MATASNSNYWVTRVRNKFPIGTRFSRLVITGYYPKTHKGYTQWGVTCRCDCGNEKQIDYPKTLRVGFVRSCGCLNSELASQRRKGKTPAGALQPGRSKFNAYRRASELRLISFELTFPEFDKLTTQNCTYCGQPPEQYQARRNKRPDLRNGIDRLDSRIGYTRDNSVPCCKQCNRAKGKLSVDDFTAWIERLVNFLSC